MSCEGTSVMYIFLVFFKQRTAYEMRISDWSSDVCSSDLGRPVELLDLPDAYSLEPSSPDERVTRDVITGAQAGERLPDAIIVVVDAANLDNHLRFTLQLIALGLPVVVALNMIDLATRDGLTLDPEALARELGVPVVPTVAVRRRGIDDLKQAQNGR